MSPPLLLTQWPWERRSLLPTEPQLSSVDREDGTRLGAESRGPARGARRAPGWLLAVGGDWEVGREVVAWRLPDTPFSLQARPSWAALWPAGWGPQPHPMGARCRCPLTSPSAPPPPAACPWCSCGPPMPMKVRSVWRAGCGLLGTPPAPWSPLPAVAVAGGAQPCPWAGAPAVAGRSVLPLVTASRPLHKLFPCCSLHPPTPTAVCSSSFRPITSRCDCTFTCVFIWEIPILLPE